MISSMYTVFPLITLSSILDGHYQKQAKITRKTFLMLFAKYKGSALNICLSKWFLIQIGRFFWIGLNNCIKSVLISDCSRGGQKCQKIGICGTWSVACQLDIFDIHFLLLQVSFVFVFVSVNRISSQLYTIYEVCRYH